MTVDTEFKIGKWFSGPIFPAWINAPSTLQSAHNFHGKNVVACHLKEGGFRIIYSENGKPVSAILTEDAPLVEGWKENSEIMKP
jgi:hypothetical protein